VDRSTVPRLVSGLFEGPTRIEDDPRSCGSSIETDDKRVTRRWLSSTACLKKIDANRLRQLHMQQTCQLPLFSGFCKICCAQKFAATRQIFSLSILIFHENTRPYTAAVVLDLLHKCEWEMLYKNQRCFEIPFLVFSGLALERTYLRSKIEEA
jgi:hypothetical protein